MAETLLAENNFAQKNGYRIDDNTELLAFSIGNMASAFEITAEKVYIDK